MEKCWRIISLFLWFIFICLQVCAEECHQAVSNAFAKAGITDYYFYVDDDGLKTLYIDDPDFYDLTVVRKLKIDGLFVPGTKVSDLTPIKGMNIKKLFIPDTCVSDLAPIKGMDLDTLNINLTRVSDLSPLRGMSLKWLMMDYNEQIADLTPLNNVSVQCLRMGHTSVSDISVLHGTELQFLAADGSPVSDLSPLEGLPLKTLMIRDTMVKDLTPILSLPLEHLEFTESSITNGMSDLCFIKTLCVSNGVNLEDLRDMQEQERLGDSYFTSYDVPADTDLAMRTQEAIDDMQQLVSDLEWPVCLKNVLDNWWEMDLAENLATNLAISSAVAEYLNFRLELIDVVKTPKKARFMVSNDVIKAYSGFLQWPTCTVDSSCFDVNNYLSVLPQLNLVDGYVLDYVYSAHGGNGVPCIYGRKIDAPRITSPDLLYLLTKKSNINQAAYVPYQNILKPEDCVDGYVQLAVFDHLCEQFYLSWHGGYRRCPLIASYQGIERFLKNPSHVSRSRNGKRYGLPIAIMCQVRQIDPAPRVEITDASVSVSLVEFSEWGGFYRHTLTFSKKFPHQILGEERETLVEYDCGFMF